MAQFIYSGTSALLVPTSYAYASKLAEFTGVFGERGVVGERRISSAMDDA